MTRRVPVRVAGAAALTVVALAVAAVVLRGQARPPGRSAAPPRLVLVLVMDQFRADYIDVYGRQWTKGLHRLLTGGAQFTRAAYPYALTYTCAGHATIATGALPLVHGMMSNTFFDRAGGRTVPCAFDPHATSVAFGDGKGTEHHSFRSMRAPTFAESLRDQTDGLPQIVSLALKPRSAIALAGRAGPGVTVVWEEDNGTWATSDAYTKTPWPDVDLFVRQHPIADDYGRVWERLRPEREYLHADMAPGEGRPAPWTQTFPHPLESPSGEPDLTFVSAWERSPWSDAFLLGLARHLLSTRKLGTTTGTDYLAISLPALDTVGHEFGPRSHEVQDVLLRADVEIGRLLDALDRQVGRGRYVVAFTSDHGVAPLPEQLTPAGADAGRISSTAIRNAAVKAAASVLNVELAAEVAAVFDQQVAFAPVLMDRLKRTPGAIEAVKSAVAGIAGIAAVYSADEILDGAESTDPLVQQWRLSYVPGRGGDFVFVTKPQWMARTGSGTTHGTLHPYDQRVPVLFYGAGVAAGRYDSAASPADIAPTLSRLTGVRMPQAQGRVLSEALTGR